MVHLRLPGARVPQQLRSHSHGGLGVIKSASKFLMVSALAAIGLGTSIVDFRRAGAEAYVLRYHHRHARHPDGARRYMGYGIAVTAISISQGRRTDLGFRFIRNYFRNSSITGTIIFGLTGGNESTSFVSSFICPSLKCPVSPSRIFISLPSCKNCA